jgi:hypothetical protein
LFFYFRQPGLFWTRFNLQKLRNFSS